MDPRTALIIATLMMLLNGGVLGLMHRGLSADVQPSAADWRIGTLLAAGGSVLLAVQASLPAGFILPVGNGCLLAGLALYWRAVRRFDGLPDTPWIFAPAALATLGVFVFAAIVPSLLGRVLIASVAWVASLVMAAQVLWRGARDRPAVSRNVLAALLAADAIFMLLRAAYYVLALHDARSILDANDWINALTPLVMAVLPVIGTTAFLMMCSERIRRQWETAAATDYLTGLPNRRAITTGGESRFAAARRRGDAFAVAVLDIDHFKSINDRLGHDMGDRALRHVAALLEQHCRGPHAAGRQGGEEFVVLLDAAGPAEAQAAAERLRRAIEQSPVLLGGKPVTITVSVGVATLGPALRDYDALLRLADRALYAAKGRGRNCVVFDDGAASGMPAGAPASA